MTMSRWSALGLVGASALSFLVTAHAADSASNHPGRPIKIIDVGTWLGVLAPTGTPQPVIDKLNAAIVKAVKDPAISKQLLTQGIEPHPSTQAEFMALIAREIPDFKNLVAQPKLTVN